MEKNYELKYGTMISVIVPAYNAADTIVRTLDSIMGQTYPHIEIIVVDDGSSDGTAEVLDDYAAAKDGRVHVIHKENAGVTAARLDGVAAAAGEWIGFVDGDDTIEPEMYERLLRNAQKYGAQISHCGYQMNFADGRVHCFHNTGRLAQQDRLTGLKDLLDGSLVEPGLCNKLFHKTLFHSLLHSRVMDRGIRINEDLLMNYLLFRQAKASVFEDICPYHYIVRSNSASRAKLNEHKIFDPIRVKKIVLDLDEPGMQEDARRAYLSTCVNVYNGLALQDRASFSQERRKVRAFVMEAKDWIPLLSRKQQLLARMIIFAPAVHRVAYRLYVRFLQKNPYE